MDPALEELVETGDPTDEVAVVVRLQDAAHVPAGVRLIAQFGAIATARVQRLAVRRVWQDPSVISLKAPRWYATEYGPVLDPADAENTATTDTDARRPAALAVSGHGTVIGVIDWGCDFSHPDFVAPDGKSRVLALWDQRTTKHDGNRYGYGRVHHGEALTAALATPDPYATVGYHPGISDTGVGAHGTHVMSIAAGNGHGGGPSGIAPEASLAFVHLGTPGWEKAGPLGDSVNLLEAIDFIVAIAAGRPLVFNLSMGRHGGPHDGTQLVERALDWLMRSRPGIAVVQSGGNYFARHVHGCGRLRSGEDVELAFKVNPGDDTPNELEVWYSGKDVFGLQLVAPDDHGITSVALGGKEAVVTRGRRTGTLYHRVRDPNNGDNHINLFQYQNAPPGVWKVKLRGIDVVDGRYHAWLERDPGCKTCQALFLPDDAVSATTTGSICNGFLTISVGAYDGHDAARPLAAFSSSGPTRDGRVKPVVLAPGMKVLAARSHPKSGTAPQLTRMSGTSMAAPHVTGTIALMFEAAGALDIVRLRELLFDTLTPSAAEDAADRERIGYGYLDTAAAVKRAAERTTHAPGKAPAFAHEPSGEATREAAITAAAIESSTDADAERSGEAVAAAPSERETQERAMCCGEKCENCEHCRNYPCETCECCQPQQAAADALATGAPIGHDPAGHDPSWHSTAEPGKPLESAAALRHPVDAAEAALQAGVFDPDRFLQQTLAGAGRAWPAEWNARTLFDAFAGRAAAQQRAALEQRFRVIAQPGRMLRERLRAGDIVIRRGENGFAHPAIIAHPLLYREQDATAQGLVLEGPWLGYYAHIVEPGMLPRPGSARFARRLAAADGEVLGDTLVLRPQEADEAAVAADEADEASGEASPQGDPNVRWLQAALNRAINAGLDVDGIEGPLTRAAIRNFQASHGLTVDGICGPQTTAALAAIHPPYGGYQPPSYTLPGYQPPRYTPPGGYTPPPRYPSGYRPPQYTPPPYTPPRYTPPGAYAPPHDTPYTPPRYTPPSYTPPAGGYAPPQYTPPRGDYTPPPQYTPPRGDYAPPGKPPGGDHAPPQYTPPSGYTGGSPPEGGPPGAACRVLDRFNYDSAALTADHRAAVEELARRLIAASASAVDLVGHASPEGLAAYNLALGQRRADAVAAALRAALDRNSAGASARIRFSVTSQGEARIISAEPARNRRVEVCYAEGPPPPVPPQTQLRIRYSVETPQGQAMLQKYEQAVRLMMAEPAGSPRSWLFQWYTHGVRGDRGKTPEINRIYGATPSANRALANAMWDTCQAHHRGAPGNDERFFLPWHRIYVEYFERICRRLLNDDSFTLPYWNYSNAASRSLPAAFRRQGSPLFRRDRNPGINGGAGIDQNSPPESFSAVPSLQITHFDPNGVEQGFNDFLDGDLHGNVHVAIGNRVGMGTPPWAANDPIFWLHHCNIDRLWASWNRGGRQNPTDAAWLTRTLTFADENGQMVTATVRDFISTTARGYTYDRFEPLPGAQPQPEAIMAEQEPARRPSTVASSRGHAPSAGGIALGSGPIRVHLAPAHEGAAPFADQIEALGDTQRLFLVVNNYRAEAHPGVLYHVYLDLPAGPSDQHQQGHYVGTMNFFDAVPRAGHDPATMTGARRSFDVTDVVRRLHAEGRAGTAPSVTIVPAGQPASEARPVIGDISLVGQ